MYNYIFKNDDHGYRKDKNENCLNNHQLTLICRFSVKYPIHSGNSYFSYLSKF